MTDWIDEAEEKVSEGLIKLANQGSVPAANAALKLLAEKRQASHAEAHRKKVEELKETPTELCRYLGTLGQSAVNCRAIIGRKLEEEEVEARNEGALERSTEIRAIDLSRVRAHGGKIEEWMRK